MLTLTDLRPKQKPAINFIYANDETLVFADVGSGKTVMFLTAFQTWIVDGDAEGAIVLGPELVLQDTWLNECDEWEHLDPDVLTMQCLVERNEAQRVALIESRPRIILCSYTLLSWLMTTYPNGVPGYDVLCCDEIDKLKDHKTRRFSGLKRRIDPATKDVLPAEPGMKEWRENFAIRDGMTGTPASNSLLDLWAIAYVIDGGQRLGDNYYDFRNRHFYQSDWGGFKYAVLPGREQWIMEQLSDITVRVEVEEGKDTPHKRILPPTWVHMPRKLRAQYRRFERDYLIELERRGGDVAEIEADGAGTAYGKCRQMAQGMVYVDDPDTTGERDVEWVHKEKLKALDNLISELMGQQLLIVYHYRAQLTALQEKYGDRLATLSGAENPGAIVETWNNREIQLLAVQPQNAGHGLNLQKGGARHIAVMTLPESAGLWIQVIGRLARGGNPSGEVFVHPILCKDTVDADRWFEVVHGKVLTNEQALAAVKSRQR